MKNFYPISFDLFSSVISVFDIGVNISENNIISLNKGLDFDMQQLLRDQKTLTLDYKKASDRVSQDISGDPLE